MTIALPDSLWQEVAARLRGHVGSGRRHLLTEDSLRMETVLALAVAGVPAQRLDAEVFLPELAGGKLDLVVDPPAGIVIESKYPRGSRTGINPDTMTFGELLRDFLRVAVVPAHQRWVVAVLDTRLVSYLQGVEKRHSLRWPVEQGAPLRLEPNALAGLPDTAKRAIGAFALGRPVTATCTVVATVIDELTLYAFSVEAAGPTMPVQPLAPGQGDTPAPLEAPAGRTGARSSIIASALRVMTLTGADTFTAADVIADMRANGETYAVQTIRTMLGSHMNADRHGPGIGPYADVRRVDHGRYRLI